MVKVFLFLISPPDFNFWPAPLGRGPQRRRAPKPYPHYNVDDSRRPKPLPGGETKNQRFFFCRAPPDWGLFCRARQAVTTAPKPCARCAWLTQGAQALRSVWFGDLKAPKSYAHYNLETPRPPNLMHTVVWSSQGAQTLRPLWFGGLKAPKSFAWRGNPQKKT